MTVFWKYYRVFNIEEILQVDFELPTRQINANNHSIYKCDELLLDMRHRPEIRHKENMVFYNTTHDYINIPPIELFKTSAFYYSVPFRKLIHSIGHLKILNRFECNEISNFNSVSYRKEKLVAEIGAAFLNNRTGILNDETLIDSADYIQRWLNKLRNDKKFVVEAYSSKDMILEKLLKMLVAPVIMNCELKSLKEIFAAMHFLFLVI